MKKIFVILVGFIAFKANAQDTSRTETYRLKNGKIQEMNTIAISTLVNGNVPVPADVPPNVAIEIMNNQYIQNYFDAKTKIVLPKWYQLFQSPQVFFDRYVWSGGKWNYAGNLPGQENMPYFWFFIVVIIFGVINQNSMTARVFVGSLFTLTLSVFFLTCTLISIDKHGSYMTSHQRELYLWPYAVITFCLTCFIKFTIWYIKLKRQKPFTMISELT